MKYVYWLLLPFLFLAVLAHSIPYFPFDIVTTRIIQNIHLSVFDLLMKAVSSVGNGRAMPFASVAIVSLLVVFRLKLEAVYLLLSSLSAFLVGDLVKILVARPRPDGEAIFIYKQLADNGFPSSHTITYTVLFGFLYFICYQKLKPSFAKQIILFSTAFLIATVGISRIYLGAHWASDVLGGYLLGILWLLITINIYKSHVQR
jgi:undecaprenyl-diphosphatase